MKNWIKNVREREWGIMERRKKEQDGKGNGMKKGQRKKEINEESKQERKKGQNKEVKERRKGKR
jgi:hypothetical protein